MKFIRVIFILSLLVIFSTVVMGHPYHHTLAVFDENKATKQLELSFKMLSEDYALITQSLVAPDYINKHLKVVINDQHINGDYQGMEADVDFTWLYFTYELKGDFKEAARLDVVNTLLLEINDKQVNTVRLNILGQLSSYNFTATNRRYQFIIE